MERIQFSTINTSTRVTFVETKPFIMDEIDVTKMLICKKEPYGKKSPLKYFIGYNDNDVIRPLCIKLPQMIG